MRVAFDFVEFVTVFPSLNSDEMTDGSSGTRREAPSILDKTIANAVAGKAMVEMPSSSSYPCSVTKECSFGRAG